MKQTFTLLICLFCLQDVYSQTVFDGKLILKEKAIYNYKLVLNIDTVAKKVSGYSITDEKGKEEAKTLIKGTYNPQKKKITISEYQIERTKVKAKDIVFCFIEAELTMSKVGEDSTLVGQFTGRLYPKQTVCGTGGIFVKQINRKKKVKDKQLEKLVEKPKPLLEPKQEEKVDLSKFEKVKTNTELQWSSDSIRLEVWDQGNLDGDSISIFIDGNLVASNIKLTSTKTIFKLPISKANEHVISILAENEGRYPPNTAAMHIYDNSKRYALMCESKIHEMKSIKLKR